MEEAEELANLVVLVENGFGLAIQIVPTDDGNAPAS